jgi:holo-[acyl-carrier protein] synthase
MIHGLGMDLVDIARFRLALRRSGDRLLRRVYTTGERAYCDAKVDPVPHYAVRFAAREAFLKAMGTGLRGPFSLSEIEVVRGADGRPSLQLHGASAAAAAALGVVIAHVALSHSEATAGAVVVLEKLSPP